MGGKGGLEGGYVCLDSVCGLIFFLSQNIVRTGHYKLKCIPWVVSAALAPTLISHGVPAEKGS